MDNPKNEEIQKELDEEKKASWENFQKLEYDKLTPEERLDIARHLYETMSKHLASEAIILPFNFWEDYARSEEIKTVQRFIKRIDELLDKVPSNPTKDTWLDKERGIIPNLKREWKSTLEPFSDERKLREIMKHKAEELFNRPEYENKEVRVDAGASVKNAQEHIEKEVYKPTREKIEKLEGEIKKKVRCIISV